MTPINIEGWDWVYLCMVFPWVRQSLLNHGTERTQLYNGYTALLASATVFGLMYLMGAFN